MNSVLDWRRILVRRLHGSLVSIMRLLNASRPVFLREASFRFAPLRSPLPTQASWRAPQSPRSSGPATTACRPILCRTSWTATSHWHLPRQHTTPKREASENQWDHSATRGCRRQCLLSVARRTSGILRSCTLPFLIMGVASSRLQFHAHSQLDAFAQLIHVPRAGRPLARVSFAKASPVARMLFTSQHSAGGFGPVVSSKSCCELPNLHQGSLAQ